MPTVSNTRSQHLAYIDDIHVMVIYDCVYLLTNYTKVNIIKSTLPSVYYLEVPAWLSSSGL